MWPSERAAEETHFRRGSIPVPDRVGFRCVYGFDLTPRPFSTQHICRWPDGFVMRLLTRRTEMCYRSCEKGWALRRRRGASK